MRLPPARRSGVTAAVVRYDRWAFERVARAHTPWLDRAVPLLSRSANHGALWVGVAIVAGAGGDRRRRRAALRGVGSIAATSLLVNQGVKRAVRRPRPSLRRVPAVRQVPVAPLTTSFPSGHAASAAAFTASVCVELSSAAPALAVLAGAVGASRVYVGVHYPLDVVVGAAIGATIGSLTRRVWRPLPRAASGVSATPGRRPGQARAR